MAELDFAARVAAAAEEMRRKGVDREVVRTEALPPDVRMVIEQILATVKDHEARLVQSEAFQTALIREATSKLRGVA